MDDFFKDIMTCRSSSASSEILLVHGYKTNCLSFFHQFNLLPTSAITYFKIVFTTLIYSFIHCHELYEGFSYFGGIIIVSGLKKETCIATLKSILWVCFLIFQSKREIACVDVPVCIVLGILSKVWNMNALLLVHAL